MHGHAITLAQLPLLPSSSSAAAHSLVLLHMLPAFQLFAQPVFALIESWVDGRLQQRQQQKSPGGGGYACGGGAWAARALAPLPLRLWWRSAYVLLMTFLAIMMPFFNDVRLKRRGIGVAFICIEQKAWGLGRG